MSMIEGHLEGVVRRVVIHVSGDSAFSETLQRLEPDAISDLRAWIRDAEKEWEEQAGCIVMHNHDSRWRIHVRKTDGEHWTQIKLEWGWTAGMSPKELDDLGPNTLRGSEILGVDDPHQLLQDLATALDVELPKIQRPDRPKPPEIARPPGLDEVLGVMTDCADATGLDVVSLQDARTWVDLGRPVQVKPHQIDVHRHHGIWICQRCGEWGQLDAGTSQICLGQPSHRPNSIHVNDPRPKIDAGIKLGRAMLAEYTGGRPDCAGFIAALRSGVDGWVGVPPDSDSHEQEIVDLQVAQLIEQVQRVAALMGLPVDVAAAQDLDEIDEPA